MLDSTRAPGRRRCAVGPPVQLPVNALSAPPATSDGASAPTEYLTVDVQVRSPGDGDIVCEKEATTGSHWKRRVCRTRSAMEQQRAASQEWLRTGGFSGSPSVVR